MTCHIKLFRVFILKLEYGNIMITDHSAGSNDKLIRPIYARLKYQNISIMFKFLNIHSDIRICMYLKFKTRIYLNHVLKTSIYQNHVFKTRIYLNHEFKTRIYLNHVFKTRIKIIHDIFNSFHIKPGIPEIRFFRNLAQ